MKLIKIDDYRWEVPKSTVPGMRVPGIIYASEKMIKDIEKDNSVIQVANVATLPGIKKASLAMPDIHYGYGFPIGGVMASDYEKGIVSPGGVGFDINCGVRLVRTNLIAQDIKNSISSLINELFKNIPTGVGSRGKLKLKRTDFKDMLVEGAKWAVKKGFGIPEDVEVTEENGALSGANPDVISRRAYERGYDQPGTLGSGNHFIELQEVVEIYDYNAAKVMGLEKGMLTIMIHSGSRGFGHQVCSDFLSIMLKSAQKYNIVLRDKQLACAPIKSPEGQKYLSALACAANYAWANRQFMMHWVREVFERFFKKDFKELGMFLVYDVAHNIVKIEDHIIDGKKVKVAVHRKGATRAFPPKHPDIPDKYKDIGQPVLIPGDMGRASYVLVGTEKAMKETFGSTCHGAGRVLSRAEAIRRARKRHIKSELASKGISVRYAGKKTLMEEMPDAYKDVSMVVEVVHKAGISKKVAKLVPLGVIKG